MVNLSNYQPTKHELSLLEKGLNFIPTPYREHETKIIQDFLLFERKCRLYHKYNDPEKSQSEEHLADPDEEPTPSHKILRVNKGYKPKDHEIDPNILAYKSICLQNLKDSFKTTSRPRFNLKKKERKAIKSLTSNKDIVIKPADKGGAIVIMNKEDYKQEGLRQLSKSEHYKKLEDPEKSIKSFIERVNNTLKTAMEDGLIKQEMKDILFRESPRTSNLYLLPKIHKANNPGRPIINSIGSITETLSAYVDEILRKYSSKCQSYVKDTSHFLNIIKDQKTDQGAYLCTIDVSALYTNIPHKEGIKRCTEQMKKLGATNEEQDICKRLLELILECNYFEFFDEKYLQVSGTAMGTRCAPNYAILFMANLEEEMLQAHHSPPSIWYRFIDDIFMIWNGTETSLNNFLEFLNGYHQTIKFTEEHSQSGLPFLDTFVYIENNTLKTRLYRKPTDNKQYLHYRSCHPKQHKDAIPYGLLVRAKRICTEIEDFKLEAYRIIKILYERMYPMDVLEKALKRINSVTREELLKPTEKNKDQRIRYILTYNPANPDIKNTTSKNLHLMEKLKRNPISTKQVQYVYRKSSNLRSLIISGTTTSKEKPEFKCMPCNRCKTCPRINQANEITSNEQITFKLRTTSTCQTKDTVYCLQCLCCNKHYVGQTGQTTNLRMRNHESKIRTKCTKNNPVAQHFNDFNKSETNYKVTILDQEQDLNKRLRLEESWMFCLNTLQPSGLNTKL